MIIYVWYHSTICISLFCVWDVYSIRRSTSKRFIFKSKNNLQQHFELPPSSRRSFKTICSWPITTAQTTWKYFFWQKSCRREIRNKHNSADKFPFRWKGSSGSSLLLHSCSLRIFLPRSSPFQRFFFVWWIFGIVTPKHPNRVITYSPMTCRWLHLYLPEFLIATLLVSFRLKICAPNLNDWICCGCIQRFHYPASPLRTNRNRGIWRFNGHIT